jgi:hypothetical protein
MRDGELSCDERSRDEMSGVAIRGIRFVWAASEHSRGSTRQQFHDNSV